MEKSDQRTFFSAIHLRDRLLHHILDNTAHTLLVSDNPSKLVKLPDSLSERHHIRVNSYFEYCYHYTYLMGMMIAKIDRYKKRLSPSLLGMVDDLKVEAIEGDSVEETTLFERLIQNDTEDHNYFFGLVAWLTIDDFRWHKLPGFKHIRSDLSYELVLSYPDIIIPLAKFILKDERHEGLLTRKDLETIDAIAKSVCGL